MPEDIQTDQEKNWQRRLKQDKQIERVSTVAKFAAKDPRIKAAISVVGKSKLLKFVMSTKGKIILGILGTILPWVLGIGGFLFIVILLLSITGAI